MEYFDKRIGQTIDTWPNYISELDLLTGEIVAVHRFVFSYEQRYREITSYSAFFAFPKRQPKNKSGYVRSRAWTDTRLFKQLDGEIKEECFPRYLDAPLIQHESIWAFYTHIGYNRRTHKFEKGSPANP